MKRERTTRVVVEREDYKLQETKSFKYLGRVVSDENERRSEIMQRIQYGYGAHYEDRIYSAVAGAVT